MFVHAKHERKRARTAVVETLAWNSRCAGAAPESDDLVFKRPCGLAIDVDGSVLVADGDLNKILRVRADGSVTTVAGDGTEGWKDGPGRDAKFDQPLCIATDLVGNILVSEGGHRIRVIDEDGNVSTLTGSIGPGFENGPAATAKFQDVSGLVVDAVGDIIVADSGNNCIRKIDQQGHVSTLAGSVEADFKDGPSGTARFSLPCGVAVDGECSVYVADAGNFAIRKIEADGMVSTLAGGQHGRSDGSDECGGFKALADLAVDGDGNVFVADLGSHTIRRVSALGVVSTVAGSGAVGVGDGPAERATFAAPHGVDIDGEGSLVVSESPQGELPQSLSRIRLVRAGLRPPRGSAVEREGAGGAEEAAAGLAELQGDLLALLDAPGDFADVTFQVEGRQLRAHRAILAARSDYYRAMFAARPCEGGGEAAAVAVEGSSYEALRAVLRFCYGSVTEVEESLLGEVLVLAERFGERGLAAACARRYAASLAPENALPRLVFSHQHALSLCERPCLRFARRHLRAIRLAHPDTLRLLDPFPALADRLYAPPSAAAAALAPRPAQSALSSASPS